MQATKREFNRHLVDEEEGIRTMVADCMGCLACLEPNVILPQVQSLVVAKMNGKDPIHARLSLVL